MHESFPSETVPTASAVAIATAAATPAPAALVDAREAIKGTITTWTAAWSSRDVGTCLRSCGRGFRPPGGMARAAWQAEREQRPRAPASIQVRADNPSIEVLGVDRGRKVLELALDNGAWRIVSEVSN